MRYVYLPVYRIAVSYLYSFGRRWSILEHMLLVESATYKRSAAELAETANVPQRLVIEALINLLKANWIEVRSDNDAVLFAATPAGQRRANERTLPERLQRNTRWDSLCVDRATGHWMRADDLDLVYERDLPADATKMPALLHTFEPNDATLRDLFRLNLDESLEPAAPQFRPPSMPHARVGIAFGEVQSGLPSSAPLALRQQLVEMSARTDDDGAALGQVRAQAPQESAMDDLTAADLIVGGAAHLDLVRQVLADAASAVVIHSCFLSARTLRTLLPDIEKAARRRVGVELLWGLHVDPEEAKRPDRFAEFAEVLAGLPTGVRGKVRLSPQSSGSHAKVIIYNDRNTGRWTTVIGSCNFLSSDFDWLEVSVRTRSALFASKVLGWLLSNQLPTLGNWSGTAKRLNTIWSDLKRIVKAGGEVGSHSLTLVTDYDHHACVALARDHAARRIDIACDLYGLSAETSVLVPMATAAARGIDVRLKYTRPSRFLLEEGREPGPVEIRARGIEITRVEDLHAKYLGWDDDRLVVSSFNWMATSVDMVNSRGAEMGVLIEGTAAHTMLLAKLVGTAGA